jgi:phenylalanyl-tRNA synthetase beta chain
MANIKFSRKVFEKEVGKLDEKMQEKIAMFGTPLESFDRDEIELEIFPNRPDLLSYSGFKRGFLGFLGKKKGIKEYKIEKALKDYEVEVDKSVKDVRPFTACAIVKNLKFDDDKIKELIDLQEKLHVTIGRKRKKLAIGVYPLEKIKLPIKYSALQPDKISFVPLESSRKMNGLEILQRHPAGRDYAHLLAGKAKFPVFMDSAGEIMSMPPIINSEKTGRVSDETKEVFVECSGFDKELLNKCLNILVSALAEMGGKIYEIKFKGEIKGTSPNFSREKLKISLETTNNLLGLDLKEKDLKICLEKMGHNYSKGIVEIASWRVDVLHEIDLIEDVAIAYGYENFKPEIPEIVSIGKEDFTEIVKRKIANILTGLSLLEVSNYHLIPKNDLLGKMGINEKSDKNIVEVEGKTEYNVLRRNLSSYLMKNFSENSDSEYPQRIFEVGRIFELREDEIKEVEKLSFGVAPGNYTDVRQILDYLSKMLDLKFEVKEVSGFSGHYIDGRVAGIFLDGKQIGEVGEVHPKILRNWKIKMPVSLVEIDLENIFEKFK